MNNFYNIIIIGAGHAGCEAALACSRMGMRTLIITMNMDTIAQMSCNPAIGGLAKGQIVREIDALGGEMAKATDETGIQFRMLNTKKGPAVHGPRAQADRKLYQFSMKRRLENQNGLSILQDTAEGLNLNGCRICGVKTKSGLDFLCEALIITTGTFLRGVIHIGQFKTNGGRAGEFSSDGLSASLESIGLKLERLKTGTPPRINGRTIDYSRLKRQDGDPVPRPFSFSTNKIECVQLPCYITHTTPHTHEIILANIQRAPLYTGQIKSTGPRYCPSIETKVIRFKDKTSHQVFIEPEGLNTSEIYLNGVSTSIPQDVQIEMVHSIPGLEMAEIVRFGYAIEYDFVPPLQIRHTLETKNIENLFLAGQINGTSGYEEAACQGIIAGINAAYKVMGKQPLVLSRSEAYTGVLIDDLVTKGTLEPYRMFTSRSEYRLFLRHDNADRRLMKYGYEAGLISSEMWERLNEKERLIHETHKYIQNKRHANISLNQILKRTDIHFSDLEKLDSGLSDLHLPADVKEQVEIEAKYEGYITRQTNQMERFQRLDEKLIPPYIDYNLIKDITNEAREKLSQVRPVSLGQASRIPGITPSDITVLMIYIEKKMR